MKNNNINENIKKASEVKLQESSNNKKRNKKVLLALIALIVVVLIGGTFAYFSSLVDFTNVFKTGTYKVTSKEVFESPTNWIPGEEIPKTVTTKNEGSTNVAVRISYKEEWIDRTTEEKITNVPENAVILNLDNTSDWTYSNGYYYYNYYLKTGEKTSSFLKSVTLNPSLGDLEDEVVCSGSEYDKVCESVGEIAGAKYKLTLTIETVQSDKFNEVWNTDIVLSDVKYKKFSLYDQIKFDPVKFEICDSDDSSDTCYEWMVISANDTVYELFMLDVNDDLAWSLSNPADIIKNATRLWSDKLTVDPSFDIVITDTFSMNFSETKARLLLTSEYNSMPTETQDVFKEYCGTVKAVKFCGLLNIENEYVDQINFGGIITTYPFTAMLDDTKLGSASSARPVIKIDLTNDVGNATE